ncbi:hypothetical protein FAF44_33125 [Nonomuraea sp. MG754425]|uniref:hypothetical protein n=1 Tax=Nonomuraea sp. MG754425 TaxID=2570319 RepID=UPI001F4130A2|nr:hypothetical protein [Nonomuraea sp. MG754425]MCF6473194.1 hypothetical protein [Nonomuraea sp. MG754425]
MSPTAGAGIVLPFDAYRLTPNNVARIAAGEHALLRACMKRRGLRWTRPARPASARGAVKIDENARRYGLADEATARRHGYHVPDDLAQVRAQAKDDAWYSTLTMRERTALKGCLSEAETRLRDGVGDLGEGWFPQLDVRAFESAAADPDVVRATTEWNRCMAQQGYVYPDPLRAIADPRWKLGSPATSPLERAVATADVRCKRSADLVALRAAAETRIQRELIGKNAGRLESLERSNARLLRNADAARSGR